MLSALAVLWAGDCYALVADTGFGAILGALIWSTFAVFGIGLSCAAGAVKGAKAGAITFLVIFVGLPMGVSAHMTIKDFFRARHLKQIDENYLKLCSEPGREAIFQTASGVDRIAFWPEKGEPVQEGGQAHFGLVEIGSYLGRENGRYGGFVTAQKVSPSSNDNPELRYLVLLKDNTPDADRIDQEAARHVVVEVIDRATSKAMAVRKDFLYEGARGCDFPTQPDWRAQNLKFLHKVLNPPTGVEVIRINLPAIHSGLVIDTEKIPTRFKPAIQNISAVQPGVSYTGYESKMPNGIVKRSESLLVLKQPNRDIEIEQGLGYTPLWVAQFDQGDLIVFYAPTPGGWPPYLIFRQFSADGILKINAVLDLPPALEAGTSIFRAAEALTIDKEILTLRVAASYVGRPPEKAFDLVIDRSGLYFEKK